MTAHPRSLRDLLGTPAGDRALVGGSAANDLYQALVGSPGRDSYNAAVHSQFRIEAPEAPKEIPEHPDTPPKRVTSERVDGPPYSSRDTNPGLGYPSCSRALCNIIKVFRDNNGYYKHIGVLPNASTAQIRKALATLYRRTHPDTGWSPDTTEFMYLREIAAVLLNKRRRERYDNLRPGEKWIDSRVKAELNQHDDSIVMGAMRHSDDQEYGNPFTGSFRKVEPEPETVRQIEENFEADGGWLHQDRRKAMNEAAAKNGYDFFADRLLPGDFQLAQDWYQALVAVAPIFGYTRSIRVFLWDKDPLWSDMGGILKISRRWPPDTARAFALFSVLGVS